MSSLLFLVLRLHSWCRTNNTSFPEVARAPEVTTQDQGRVPIEATGATMLELHEIWQVEGKQHRLNLGKFIR